MRSGPVHGNVEKVALSEGAVFSIVKRLDFCVLRCFPKAMPIKMKSTSRENVDPPEI